MALANFHKQLNMDQTAILPYISSQLPDSYPDKFRSKNYLFSLPLAFQHMQTQ